MLAKQPVERYQTMAEVRAALESVLKKCEDMLPSVPAGSLLFGHFFQRRVTEAREAAEEAFRRTPWNAAAVGFLAGLLSQAGEKEHAENLIVTMRGAITVGMIHLSPSLLRDRCRH